MSRSDSIRSAFLTFWHEYAVYNLEDIDGREVVAQGTCSGRYYVLTLDDDGHVTDAEAY
jgi:hypothetical protein